MGNIASRLQVITLVIALIIFTPHLCNSEPDRQSKTLYFRYFPQRRAEWVDASKGTEGTKVKIHIPSSHIEGYEDWSMVADLKGRNVYLLEESFSWLYQYRVGNNSRVIELKPVKVQANSHPTSITFHPKKPVVYVCCSHGAIWQYRIERDGSLHPLKISAVGVRGSPMPLRFDKTGEYACIVEDGWSVTPSGEYDENANGNGATANVYRIGSDGALKFMRRVHCDDDVSVKSQWVEVKSHSAKALGKGPAFR